MCIKFLKNSSCFKQSLALLFLVLVFFSCNKKRDDPAIINLQWNKSFITDSLERNKTALAWQLSYLGSNYGLDTNYLGVTYDKNKITLDVSKVGFNKKAIKQLSKLHKRIKESEEYQFNNALDLGKYIALTIGDTHQYYKIVGTPSKLSAFDTLYSFYKTPAYINNSSISHVDRIISYSKNNTATHQAYISKEVDSITKQPLEFETVEVLPNGQLRFGLYDTDGNLKEGGDPKITKAGKPGKCMWCHESSIQPLFRDQTNVPDYLGWQSFQDSLVTYNLMLKKHQKETWQNKRITDKSLHTEMEIAYFSFMEPSAEHLANEWNMTKETVQEVLKNIPTHKHHEFDFMRELYYRKDIDRFAPFTPIPVVESFRELLLNDDKHYLSNSSAYKN